MGVAKFSILMNSRYALLSTTIVTEETEGYIDYRREEREREREPGDRGSRQNYNSSSYSSLEETNARPLSYFARGNPIKFYLFN